MDAALIEPKGIAGIVSVEPGACRASYTDEQISKLAKIPTLVVFGDNLSVPTGLGALTWQNRLDGCRAYLARIKAAGGRVDIVATAELGIRGNSHMLMQDKNNLHIADLILKWIDAKATSRGPDLASIRSSFNSRAPKAAWASRANVRFLRVLQGKLVFRFLGRSPGAAMGLPSRAGV
ncbi:hypothetical protein [Caulobacter sp. BP25]|uniref:hypothetical protein n=1 Tax=Caulobacter sp. BP25 TaxID=2048900 RepID=UPI000C12A718|nr:hypothetical protein [Caulobacter sp. BP25]PHY19940.1 hypothetical protein CSW59_08760 [Caulobacter sp. BP25]